MNVSALTTGFPDSAAAEAAIREKWGGKRTIELMGASHFMGATSLGNHCCHVLIVVDFSSG